jgi:hypothetical protein
MAAKWSLNRKKRHFPVWYSLSECLVYWWSTGFNGRSKLYACIVAVKLIPFGHCLIDWLIEHFYSAHIHSVEWSWRLADVLACSQKVSHPEMRLVSASITVTHCNNVQRTIHVMHGFVCIFPAPIDNSKKVMMSEDECNFSTYSLLLH